MKKSIWEFLPARYVLAILASIGMGICYGLKVNLSVALVRMVNHTAILEEELFYSAWMSRANLPFRRLNNSFEEAPVVHKPAKWGECKETDKGNSKHEDGPFQWSSRVQGLLLSSYFWGYLVAQIPGGRMAELFSAKWVMFFAVAISTAGTILSPVSAKLHYSALLIIRIVEGFGSGMTFPAMSCMLAHWAPTTERSFMSSIVYSGSSLGTVIFTLVSGVIASKFGWEAIFYIEGLCSAPWLIFWVFLIADTPEQQTLMTEDEREFIITSIHHGRRESMRKLPLPWKSIWKSPPFLAILVAHTCSNWGWYTLLIELPLYMKSVLKFKITKNALLTSMPYFTMWIFSIVLSRILDTLRKRNTITTTTARKIATGIASIVPIICFVVLSVIGCRPTLAIILMTIAVTSIGGMFCGFLSNHIDIAPNFAGTLFGVTNTFGTIPGIAVPLFVGRLLHNDPSAMSWQIVFWVTIWLYIVEVIVYGIFCSGEEQEWNEP